MTTGVPPGKTVKKVTFNLGRSIHGREDSSHSTGLSVDEDEVIGGEFDAGFKISIFWRDLVVLAAGQFSDKYTVERKSLGTRCKLYIQKLWNKSAQMEVTSTEMSINSIKYQMETKGRIKNSVLQLRVSLERTKAV